MRPTPSFRSTTQSILLAAAFCGSLLIHAATADTLDDIKARGHMVIAIDPTFSPYEFTTADGAITGYDPELLGLVAKDLGFAIEFQKMSFDGIIPGLVAASFDFTATALNVTAERAKRISYTVPVSKTQNVVLAAASGPVASSDPEGLSGHIVAVKAATQPEQLMKQISKDLVAKGKAPIEILSLQTVEQTAEALSAKRADFVVDDIAVMTEVAEKSAGADKIVGPVGNPVFISWGLRKSDDRLLQAVDASLIKLEANGQMKALQEKYFHTAFDLPQSDFLPK